jgi:hypothetical protein
MGSIFQKGGRFVTNTSLSPNLRSRMAFRCVIKKAGE